MSLVFDVSDCFHVFRTSYELCDMEWDLSKVLYSGGFGFVWKGVHKREIVRVRAVED